MDEGVCAVRPVEEERVLQEPRLDVEFEEEVELLLEMDDLEGVATRYVDGAFDHCDCGECATELVYL